MPPDFQNECDSDKGRNAMLRMTSRTYSVVIVTFFDRVCHALFVPFFLDCILFPSSQATFVFAALYDAYISFLTCLMHKKSQRQRFYSPLTIFGVLCANSTTLM